MGACNTNVTSYEGFSFDKRRLFGRGHLLHHLRYWWTVGQKSN